MDSCERWCSVGSDYVFKLWVGSTQVLQLQAKCPLQVGRWTPLGQY